MTRQCENQESSVDTERFGELKFLTNLPESYLAFPVHHKTLPMLRHEDPLANEMD
jgi:hypothetical protein